jgi:tRNA-methyltransferase O
MDRAGPYRARVVPYRDTREYGLFATRAPNRPNPIGMSAVRLLRREGCLLHVSDIDILDETPLLDLKPYVSSFDAFPVSRAGWLDRTNVDRRLADNRFHPPSGTGNPGRSDPPDTIQDSDQCSGEIALGTIRKNCDHAAFPARLVRDSGGRPDVGTR